MKTENATELSPMKPNNRENDNDDDKGYKPLPVTSSNALNKDLIVLELFTTSNRYTFVH